MARANLKISPDVEQTFLAAQDESSAIRALKIVVADELLILHSVQEKTRTAMEDFSGLRTLLEANAASLVLFCLTDEVTGKGKKWILIAWVPDGCKVRDKMLYSSSREDLKRSLGMGYFAGEYPCSVIEEVSWESYQNSLSKELDKQSVLTETERLVIEENALIHNEVTSSKSTAMGVLPFSQGPGVHDELSKFLLGECNWVELSVENEIINLQSSKTVQLEDDLQSIVSNDDARFFMIKLPNHEGNTITFFVFSCPDNVPNRKKMIMSSSKATVMGVAQEAGLRFDKTIEIRGSDEMKDALKYELVPTETSLTGSAQAEISHSKPRRPGGGRAKVSKFQADT